MTLHQLLWRVWLPQWRLHPLRHAAALLAVALGVALAFSVHTINQSALAEFAGAVRSVNGEPDLSLLARHRSGVDDSLFDTVRSAPGVLHASPRLEQDAHARGADGAPAVPLRVLGLDALRVAVVAPALLPRPADATAKADRLGLLRPDAAYANPAALRALGLQVGATLELHTPGGWQRLRLAGSVAAGGAPLLVLDIAAVQALWQLPGRLSRVDLRLAEGVDATALWQQLPLPAAQRAALLPQQADDATQRVSNLSRAYRVNLTVLALVALLVGGFLVWSVQTLAVAQATPLLALLGVLGLAARERRHLVLADALLLGLLGSTAGLALGTALAWAALRLLGGDLGGGYFPGVQPALHWSTPAALAHAALGVAAALAGAWWPARAAQALPPAQALKGQGAPESAGPQRRGPAAALALLLGGVGLALLPPVAGLPLAAYASVAALLLGGVALVPALVRLLLAALAPGRHALWGLALQRARHARQQAAAMVAGVVASLALCVALTVMVASFRAAVTDWLDSVLPAQLYLRSPQAALPPALLQSAAQTPGVQRVQASRQSLLQWQAHQPPVALLVRPLDAAQPGQSLPLLAPALPASTDGRIDLWPSEPMALLYGLQPGQTLTLPLPTGDVPARVRGIWRDYARQFGALLVARQDMARLGADAPPNELALWLAPGADEAAVLQRLHAAAGDAVPLEAASAAQLRRLSMAIFDRSFAVTLYLQAVAIAVGLVGVAASLSAQVLARRKEFGLLAHLGLTPGQVQAMVLGEVAAWLAAGTLLGLALGLGVSVVLVHVVNPQSFHWSMPLAVPLARLATLAAAVLAGGLLAAAWATRQAVSQQAVLAVKEDW